MEKTKNQRKTRKTGGMIMTNSSYQPWYSERAQEKQYKMTRGLTQDVGKRLKERIRKTYPKKLVKNKVGKEIDIGECCTEYHYDVVMFFGEDEEKQNELISDIREAYYSGIFLDEDEIWLDDFAEATPIFSKEIKTYAQIPRLAFKDKTEPPEKNKEEEEEWWR